MFEALNPVIVFRNLNGSFPWRVRVFEYCVYYYHHHHLLYAGYFYYIPETNYVPRKYSVVAILLLLFMVFILLLYDMDVSCHRHFFLVLLLNQR